MTYDNGWNKAIDHIIERMKNNIIKRVERHENKPMSSTYVIDKIAAEEYLKLIDDFRELKK
jgi:poly-gamma-glutamate capsule biosynthesis protein CapA/YwtB (metallophosphatase superfamily)